MTVIKWAWRHFALTSEEFDTLEEAAESAVWCADRGDEALDKIEVIEDGESRLYDFDSPEIEAIRERIWAQEDAEIKASAANSSWVVSVRHPKENLWTYWDSRPDESTATVLAKFLELDFGPERVKVKARSA